jgi:glycine betaine/proline transport system substrate-binding protein
MHVLDEEGSTMKRRRTTHERARSRWLAGSLGAMLLLTACGGGDDAADEPADDTAETDDPAEPAEPDDAPESDDESADAEGALQGSDVGDGRAIEIGWIPWEEDIAATNLWHVILEENGFEVTQTQTDVGPVFDGVATGELDLFLDAWLPSTHEDYWDEYSDQLEDLGAWLDQAPLTWVVPEYVEDINSIEDLQGNADMFDGQIVGIEPGSGLARISEEEVMPTYGLEDEYTHVTSSTAAMLAELEASISAEEPVLVTLWEPHPAYGRFDLKNLEDPENALGDPDEIRNIAREGFSDEFPEVAQALENMDIEADVLADLTVTVLDEADTELDGARQWLEENVDVVRPWLEGTGLEL